MFCQNCGTTNPDSGQFCSKCGSPLTAAAAVRPTSGPGAVPRGSFATPPPLDGNPPTSGKAIASLVCGIFTFFLPASIAADYSRPPLALRNPQIRRAPRRSGPRDNGTGAGISRPHGSSHHDRRRHRDSKSVARAHGRERSLCRGLASHHRNRRGFLRLGI